MALHTADRGWLRFARAANEMMIGSAAAAGSNARSAKLRLDAEKRASPTDDLRQ